MRVGLGLAVAVGVVLAGAGRAAPLPDAVPVEAFAALPSIARPVLSPDGTKLAAKVDVEGKQILLLRSLYEPKYTAFSIDKVDANWWRWVNDEWLIVGVGRKIPLYDEEFYATRVVAISAATGEMREIGWDRAGLDADDVIWVARDGSARFLLSKQTGFVHEAEWYPMVFEVDLAAKKERRVQDSRTSVVDWTADADGLVRLGFVNRDGKRSLIYRDNAEAKWRTIDHKEGALVPQIFRRDGTAVTFDDSSGYDELYELDLKTFTPGKKLFGLPGYDVDSVIPNAAGDDIDGFGVTDTHYREIWLNPKLKAIQEGLDASVGKRRATIQSWNRDRSVLLVELGAPDQAGSLFLWDTNRSDRMQRVAHNSNALQSRSLSPVRTIRYKARDGLEIEAVLTMPRGRPKTNLPLIVMPHGGPAVRDSEAWDWWVQFLAEEGYAVIQPNYRGSSGYGVDFLKKGEGEWGLKMQDDLVDAIAWAAKEGIADPKRVCIVGASYGGYAAMRGAQRDGAHYRCAVSYAGVSDLGAMMRYDRAYLFGKEAKTYWSKQARDFTAVSPRNFPHEFTVPILIAHGVEDQRVPVRQSRLMVDALKKAGKPHEYLEQKLGDHHFSRSEDRLQFLLAMRAFLKKHNPA